MDEETLKTIQRLAAEGLPLRKIAAQVSLSHERVRQLLGASPNWPYYKPIARVRTKIADLDELAAALGTTRERAAVACEDGQIPGAFLVGKTWLILREALAKLVDK